MTYSAVDYLVITACGDEAGLLILFVYSDVCDDWR